MPALVRPSISGKMSVGGNGNRSPDLPPSGARPMFLVDRMAAMSSTKSEPSSAGPSHWDPSSLSKDLGLERRFRELVDKWQAEIAPLSSTTARVEVPAYHAIIALGPAFSLTVPITACRSERRLPLRLP